jgi:hypothetical protein
MIVVSGTIRQNISLYEKRYKSFMYKRELKTKSQRCAMVQHGASREKKIYR